MESHQFNIPPHSIQLIRLKSCGSTNTYLRTRISELKKNFPIAVSAHTQTRGRGREERSWFSIPGKGVYLSLGFILSHSRDLNLLSLITGLTVSETLQQFTGKEFKLKWPNDVFYLKKKIAGCLIENIVSADRIVCICGMGVNLNHNTRDFPPELRNSAISARAITGSDLSPVDFEYSLIPLFFKWLKILETGKPSVIINRFREIHHIGTGEEIHFSRNRGTVKGRYMGINEDGGIEIQLLSGVTETYFSGEINTRY
jgi:BirA family biotin operon repressor/biotin-[acetyl-CoA-carboxylase] ligase